jgi:hypothetical protein
VEKRRLSQSMNRMKKPGLADRAFLLEGECL